MVFYDVMPSRLLNMLQYFWETCHLLFLLPEDGGSKFSTNCWYQSTIPCGITSQKTIIIFLIFTAKEPDISPLYLQLGTTFYPGCGKWNHLIQKWNTDSDYRLTIHNTSFLPDSGVETSNSHLSTLLKDKLRTMNKKN